MKRLLLNCVFSALWISLTGCGSLIERNMHSLAKERNDVRYERTTIYPGLHFVGEQIPLVFSGAGELMTDSPVATTLYVTVVIVDVPISLLLDTILLPWDIQSSNAEPRGSSTSAPSKVIR